MERLKRSLSMRKKRDTNIESNKPHQWQEDERKVREGSCSFQVKYLGCVEVFESRGIQICEEAVKALKSQSKSNHHRAILYVTGDALRVVDEISKGLIVDQTIEKVSFCAPDRNHEKGFAYICRDGTTRRWMCHGFLAIKESGERLSHAVGCAFAICLEKKQAREKEKVTVTFSENGTSFTRMGSFRQTTLTERLADPQSAIVAEPVPVRKVDNPYAVQRPHASADMLERQGSFRGFTRLADSSPFKRNISLRLNELPSTLERQRQVTTGIVGPQLCGPGAVGPAGVATGGFGVIMEADEQDTSPVTDACQQLSEGLMALSARDCLPVTSPPPSVVMFSSSQAASPYVGGQPTMASSGVFAQGHGVGVLSTAVGSPFIAQHQQPAHHITHHSVGAGQQQFVPYASTQIAAPSSVVHVSNPWSNTPVQSASVISPSPQLVTGPTQNKLSDAEFWLNSTASQIDPFAAVPNVGGKPAGHRPRTAVNGLADPTSPHTTTAIATVHHRSPVTAVDPPPPPTSSFISTPLRAPSAGEQTPVTCQAASQPATGSRPVVNSSAGVRPADSQPFDPFDSAFDSAWAAKTSNRSTAFSSVPVSNPFQTSVEKITPAFEVKL